MKQKEDAVVISQECIAPGVYSMWIKTDKIAEETVAGQFISVYCKEGSRILPRPISICEVKKEEKSLRIVYRIAGKGTEEFSTYTEGTSISILGPLGNGFFKREKSAMLIAGGIGVPPMVELAKELKKQGVTEIISVIGYRDGNLFLKEELEKYYGRWQCRCQRKCHECDSGIWPESRCHLFLRTKADASCSKGIWSVT